MATSDETWSADANQAVQVQLMQPSETGPTSLHDFHPRFTYPIFGEEERIFGYKDLEIDLRFAAHDLRPQVSISYKKKFPAVGSTKAFDILAALKEFLPSEAFVKLADYEKILQDDPSAMDFTPPGTFISSYTRSGKTFEVWAGSLLDPVVRQTVERMQIFISLFIEAGTPIGTTDPDWSLDRWRVYFIYEKSASSPTPTATPYSFVGYSTTYRFFRFTGCKPPILTGMPEQGSISPTTLPSVLRISQFLILPPHQSAGHGSALYQAIYKETMGDPTIRELSVEDPSEEFDKLRDINDWKVLEPMFRDAGVKINTAVDTLRLRRMPTPKLLPIALIKKIRTDTKIAGRQFARQLEMYLLSLIPYSHRQAGGANMSRVMIQKSRAADESDKSYYWFRMLMKQRIYKKNKSILQQLDLEDRIPKVDESAQAQEDEYELLLLAFATALARESGVIENRNGTGSSSRNRKRKVVDDDDDDDDDDEEMVDGPESKKTKA